VGDNIKTVLRGREHEAVDCINGLRTGSTDGLLWTW